VDKSATGSVNSFCCCVVGFVEPTDEFSPPAGSDDVTGLWTTNGARTDWRRTATDATDQRIVSAATAGDQAAFTELVERYRSELQVHAYRMLGSLEDAQDALQEAFLRAWSGRATYRGQATFRAWLYKITTNACLRILERRPRRVVPYEAVPAAEPGTRPVPPADLPWLQPYPDLLLDENPEPGDAIVARETIELAFLAAIQHLPPRQRAVLILRDALDWPADDTAAVLDMSLAAVNSALQRARATLKERLPETRLEWAAVSDAEQDERSLLQTYVEAFERHDDRQLVALLREDVRLAMPPHPTWYDGRDAVAAFFAGVGFAPGSASHRLLPTRANRQPAFGVYRGEGADATPFAINVLEIESGRIKEMHFFKYPELFPAFGLPETLG
jgi:RNA polymerase sigma-70 factor (ECF subfamily)